MGEKLPVFHPRTINTIQIHLHQHTQEEAQGQCLYQTDINLVVSNSHHYVLL